MAAKDRCKYSNCDKGRSRHYACVEEERYGLLTDSVAGTKTLCRSQEHSRWSAIKQDCQKNERVRNGNVGVDSWNLNGKSGTNDHCHQAKQQQSPINL